MDWKDVGKKVAAAGLPLLGGALGGPAGAAVGTLVSSALGMTDQDPAAVAQAVATNPDNVTKLRELEVQERTSLFKMQADYQVAMRQADSADIASVNESIREEAKSEHWAQWAWRPYNGFLYGTTVFLTYFTLPLLKITPPIVPTEVWIGWGAVLGITAWHRGVEQVKKVGPSV